MLVENLRISTWILNLAVAHVTFVEDLANCFIIPAHHLLTTLNLKNNDKAWNNIQDIIYSNSYIAPIIFCDDGVILLDERKETCIIFQ